MADLKSFWVKGSPMLADMAFIRQRYGEEGLEKVLAEMPPETADEYRNRLLASTWYTMELRLAILYAVDKLYAKGDPNFFWEMGRHQGEHNLRNYYRALIKLVGPARVAKVGAMFWGLVYKTSSINVEMSPNSVKVTLVDYPVTERFNCHVIRGYMNRVLEYGVATRTTIEGEEISCINCGDDNCVFVYRWG